MTRKDMIRGILVSGFSQLKPVMGAQEFSDLVDEQVKSIIELNKPKEQIIHVIGPDGYHRLIVDGESTKWFPPHEICKSGNLIATTDNFANQLPQLCTIKAIESIHFNTRAQQNLSMEIHRFEKPE